MDIIIESIGFELHISAVMVCTAVFVGTYLYGFIKLVQAWRG